MFFGKALNPVDLQLGPDGNLFYPDLEGGNDPPCALLTRQQRTGAIVTADPRSGAVPLTVTFDATESTDVEGDDLSYAWDLDDDGDFDDSTVSQPSTTFTSAGDYSVRVRVTDAFGANSVAAVTVNAGNEPPNAVIEPRPRQRRGGSANDSPSAAGRTTRTRAPWPIPHSRGRSCSTIARSHVTSTRSRRSPASRRANWWRPPTSTRRISSCA